MKHLLPALLLLAAPATAQPNAPTFTWCLRMTIDLSTHSCGIARDGEPVRTQTTATAARTEMVRQADVLVATGRMTAAKRASELASIRLTTPKDREETKVWRLYTDNPDTYVWITVSAK